MYRIFVLAWALLLLPVPCPCFLLPSTKSPWSYCNDDQKRLLLSAYTSSASPKPGNTGPREHNGVLSVDGNTSLRVRSVDAMLAAQSSDDLEAQGESAQLERRDAGHDALEDRAVEDREAAVDGVETEERGQEARPLWMLFRQLDRRAVNYSVLQPRHELDALLSKLEEDGAAVMDPDAARSKPVILPEPSSPLWDDGVMPMRSSSVASRRDRQQRRLGRAKPQVERDRGELADGEDLLVGSEAAAMRKPVLETEEDVLSWADLLRRDEMLVELDFLGVPVATTKKADRGALMHMLAEAMMAEVAARKRKRRRRTEAREAFSAVSPVIGDRRHQRAGAAARPDMQDEAMVDVGFGSRKGAERARRSGRRTPARLTFKPGAESEYGGYEDGGDWGYSMFDGLGRVAQQARAVLKVAKRAGRGLSFRDAEPSRSRRRTKAGVVLSRGLGRVGTAVVYAWAESAIQVITGTARWAGAGVVPSRYVLLGSGAATVIFRKGLGGFLIALLVVRACTASLNSILEAADELGSEDQLDGLTSQAE